MITVEKYDGLVSRIATVNEEVKSHLVEYYLFVPGELNFSRNIIDEYAFHKTAFTNSRTYFTSQYHLPLVHSRLASRDKLPSEQYRVSLSLYAFQYALSLEKTTHKFFDLMGDVEDEEAVEQLEDVTEMAVDILKRLRRNVPKDEKLTKYYSNIDNYLSWLTEQRFLSLIAHMPKGASFQSSKEKLIEICESESEYREQRNYNSAKSLKDPIRMTNKMRLARRLIEYPITIRQNAIRLGGNLAKLAKGAAAGLVMIFVTLLIVRTRGWLGEITMSFAMAMAGVYALREIFKDDLRDIIGDWIGKGRPKWRKVLIDPTSGKKIGSQLEWLDFIPLDKVPPEIRKLRRGKLRQREESVIKLKTSTQMSTTRFLSGYQMTREIWKLDFRPFARLMTQANEKLYTLSKGQVKRESVEKRYQFNLITRQIEHCGKETIQRWKITVNRSKVIDIEEVLGPS
ncbi:hypothetical protein CS022_21240 [Veronia nyctiphanis]|uniref:Uncharacterized protein n=1 Tax=Veronia nyctiphanis TaxID=1278244 RepID=A0A4Q0YN23_9GAMM|nr:hypothetical protein [Veronia nyctiphanis]RXJ71354.1 hypothetical protein CS022_21240 [Veronia nyctiphanis]